MWDGEIVLILIGEYGGKLFRLPGAEEIEINQELNVPADDFKAVFPNAENFPMLDMIYLVRDECFDIEKSIETDNLYFKGIVDEQVYSTDVNGTVMCVYARGMAGLLIDNECPPLMYTNPSSDIIYKKHIEPFGIGICGEITHCRGGELYIPKGSSHYKAVERFCKDFLGTIPVINAKGCFRFDCYEGTGKIVFDNCYGEPFESAVVLEKRCNRISKVYVSGESGYRIEVNDDEAQSMGIVRERYIDLAGSATHTVSDADNIIEKGRSQALELRLVCSGCFLDKIGYTAMAELERCRGREFVISQVRYVIDRNSEKSRIKCFLKKG